MITIIDYKMGNIGSIANMIKKVGGIFVIASKPEELAKASKIILPGVGSFDYGITNLEKLGLIDILNERVLVKKVPILGICLGMQIMTKSSEEGQKKGLGWINAETVKFNFGNNSIKMPHMGWNTINITKNSKLLKDMENRENRFYFVHSYYVKCFNESDILATTNYGGINFVSIFGHENILGVQFHPEKSHKFGMQLLKNFLENY
ncbi:MAG: imidazole glycerol phosphate synthase subunit HisH [bacterium]